MYVRLKSPQGIDKESRSRLDRIKERAKAGRVTLDKDRLTELEKNIKKALEFWEKHTTTLNADAKDRNDYLEGITEPSNFPFEGASKISMGFGLGMGRTLVSIMRRALFADNKPFVKKVTGKVMGGNEIEEAFNWLSTESSNLVDRLQESLFPLYRDEIVPIYGEWKRDIELAAGSDVYIGSPPTASEAVEATEPINEGLARFIEDYPTAKDAGVSQAKYDAILDALASPDSDESVITVDYDYKLVKYDGPWFHIVPLSRFVFYPLSSESLDDCVITGVKTYESINQMKFAVEYGGYDKKVADEIKGLPGASRDAWADAREAAEGISSHNQDFKRFQNFKLTIVDDLDDDGICERYYVVFNRDVNKILLIGHYPLIRNIPNIVGLKLVSREGRIFGSSLAQDGMDMAMGIDDIHRHRQNVRSITDSPTLIAPNELKEELGIGGPDFIWHPGAVLWVPKEYMSKSVEPHQMVIRNLDQTANSLDEEKSILRYSELVLGVSQLLSGQESSADPRAPATKALAMLRQTTIRADDLIAEMRRHIPKLCDMFIALYYAYGKDKIAYGQPNENGEQLEMERTLLAQPGLGWNLKAKEISLSPQFDMERIRAITEFPAIATIVQMKPDILVELWNAYINATRYERPGALLIEAKPQGIPGMPGKPGMPGMPEQGEDADVVEQVLGMMKQKINNRIEGTNERENTGAMV